MKKYPILFLISVFIFLGHFYFTKHGVYGDGNGYYSIAHTLFFTKNLDFQPIYKHLSAFQGSKYIFSRVFWDTSKTVTGVLNCPWLIGTALFWLPGFFIVWCINIVFHLQLSVFHPAYEVVSGISGICMVIGGLFFIERYIRKLYNPDTASKTVLLVYAATQLFYYTSFEPALSHQATFFLISLYLYIYYVRRKSLVSVGLAGVIVGLVFISRIGDVVVLLPFVAMQFLDLIKQKKYIYICTYILTILGAMIPQAWLQLNMYGNIFQNPYLLGQKGQFQLFSPLSILNHLFGLDGGFLLWSPLFVWAIIGLFKAKSKILPLSCLIYTLFIASWETAIPAGFGNRFFICLIPLLSVGIGYMVKHTKNRIILLGIISVFWNIGLLLYFFLR